MRVGAEEARSGKHQEGPDEAFAAKAAVGVVRDEQHENNRHDVRHRAQQAGDGDAACGALLDDGRQPEHEAVVADAPEEILDAEPDDAGMPERRLHVGYLGEEPLLALELLAELGASFFAHPCGVCWFVANDDEPDESPEDRGQAFDDEGHLPAEGADEVTGGGGHPDERDGIAEEEDGVGAGALGAGEPVGEQDQHRREDEAFGCAEEERSTASSQKLRMTPVSEARMPQLSRA